MKELIAVAILLLLTGGVNAHTREVVHPRPTAVGMVGYNNTMGNHLDYWNTPRKTDIRINKYKRTKLHRKEYRRVPKPSASSQGGLTTIPTAAGISITVAKGLANQFTGFIEDLVKDGYKPRYIHCWAPVGTHVLNSNHYHGGACDFDQTGWGKTAPRMYAVHDLAAKWGLRDGCVFRHADCGHIDDGVNVKWRPTKNMIARYIQHVTQTPTKEETRLPDFEE